MSTTASSIYRLRYPEDLIIRLVMSVCVCRLALAFATNCDGAEIRDHSFNGIEDYNTVLFHCWSSQCDSSRRMINHMNMDLTDVQSEANEDGNGWIRWEGKE